MKNTILFTLLLLFATVKGFGQANKDYQITLTINLEDCLNCQKTLYDLKSFKNSYDIRIIMRKEFQVDSAYIVKQYQFNLVADEIIWSDSLFKEYSPYGNSYVSIESKYKTNRFGFLIHDIYKRDFLNFLSNQIKPLDTLFKNYPGLARGSSKLLFNNNGLLGLNVPYNKTFSVYDFISQKKQYTIEFPEALLRQTFLFNQNKLPISEFEPQQKSMHEAGVPQPYLVTDYCFMEDTVLIKFNNRYFRYLSETDTILGFGDDTVLWSNYSLLKYWNDSLLSVDKFEYHKKENDREYFSWSGIHYFNGKIIDRVGTGIAIKNRPYMATIDKNLKNNAYELNIAYTRFLPPLFDNTDKYAFMVFSKNTYAFVPIGEIYDLTTNKSVEKLDFFKSIKKIDENTRLKMEMGEGGFFINDDFVWVSIGEDINGQWKYRYYKFNRHTRQHEIAQLVFNLGDRIKSAFDPLNPDYLIYKNNDGLIIREKIF